MPIQTLVQDGQLIEGDLRETYANSHRTGQPLANLPQVIDLLLAGKLNVGTWHDADSAGITYRDAEGTEMYAVVHGISKVNAVNQEAFPERFEGAELTGTHAAILESKYARALVEQSGIKVYGLDDLKKGQEPTEEIYAIVTERNRIAGARHGMQSIKDFRNNEFGLMLAGSKQKLNSLADFYATTEDYNEVGVWLPSEVSGEVDQESLARLLYLGDVIDGLDGVRYVDFGGRFVGVRGNTAPEAQAETEGHEQPNPVAIAMDAVGKYIPEEMLLEARRDLEKAFKENA